MDKTKLHVINKEGEKISVPFTERGQYQVDLEWYLSHGYITIEQHKIHLANKKRPNKR